MQIENTIITYTLKTSGICDQGYILSKTECETYVQTINSAVTATEESVSTYPRGCYIWVSSTGSSALYFNNAYTSTASCSTSNRCICRTSNGGNPFSLIDVGENASPTFGDLNRDGKPDLLVGGKEGGLTYYIRFGVNEYISQGQFISASKTGSFSAPGLIDYDFDGDLDIFVGNVWGYYRYYENTGTCRYIDIRTTGTCDDYIITEGNAKQRKLGINLPIAHNGAARLTMWPCLKGVIVITRWDTISIRTLWQPVLVLKINSVYVQQKSACVPNPYYSFSQYFNGYDAGQNAFITFTDIDNDGQIDQIRAGMDFQPKIFLKNICSQISQCSNYVKCNTNTGASDATALAPEVGFSVKAVARVIMRLCLWSTRHILLSPLQIAYHVLRVVGAM